MEKKGKYLSVNEIHEEETKMLLELSKFLDKHNLKYSLFAGTLIGVVRHTGFIPWDDDIDTAMLRPDFNKLIELARQNNGLINDHLKIIGYEFDKTSAFPFLKVINTNIAVECEGDDFDKFLWVDIFPVDGYKKSKRFDRKIRFLRRLYFYKRNDKWSKIPEKNKFKYFLKKLSVKLINFDRLMTKYIKFCSKYNVEDCELVSANTWGIGRKESFPKKLFDELCEYDFENIKVKAFKDAHVWLSSRYGDYMKLPPEDKRVTHNIKARKISDEK